jgi:hypothetical protein
VTVPKRGTWLVVAWPMGSGGPKWGAGSGPKAVMEVDAWKMRPTEEEFGEG